MILLSASKLSLVCCQRTISPAIWLIGASARPVSMLTAMSWPMVSAWLAIMTAPTATTATPAAASSAVLM